MYKKLCFNSRETKKILKWKTMIYACLDLIIGKFIIDFFVIKIPWQNELWVAWLLLKDIWRENEILLRKETIRRALLDSDFD